jgi:hypothetical protein
MFAGIVYDDDNSQASGEDEDTAEEEDEEQTTLRLSVIADKEVHRKRFAAMNQAKQIPHLLYKQAWPPRF